ncbi:NUDIX domain-containing protein [Actinopolymorpha sp. B17G11]|uniref:NUDIX domain-containing protein n=1 Tax=unclassified Actinopolymorpha TaxID=2627063 RepID=UPI0032D94FE5
MRPRLRHAVRALIVDDEQRILLCRFDLSRQGIVVWASPGGGIEPGETLLGALRRELDEEVGLALDGAPPHVWHQVVEGPGHARHYDGVVNDYFLLRTSHFDPRGSFTPDQLAAENIAGLRWWSLAELDAYRGADLFSPRALPVVLRELLDNGVPAQPRLLAL